MIVAPTTRFDRLAPMRAGAVPWLSVIAGSLLTAVPVIAAVPLLPPFGLLVLLGWRLSSRNALPLWSAAPLGFVDDLVSGQPLGSAVLLWSLTLLALDLIERRVHAHDFRQNWLIAAGAIAACLFGGRYLALPLSAPIDPLIAVQVVLSALLFPLVACIVAWLAHKSGAV